jgi:hypothetical protein
LEIFICNFSSAQDNKYIHKFSYAVFFFFCLEQTTFFSLK